MTKRVELIAAAKDDYLDAVEWYEDSGNGRRFMAAIDQALARLQPVEQWPVVEVRAGREIRKATVPRPFPYRLIFTELEAEVRVIAVMHTAREPGYWHDRI